MLLLGRTSATKADVKDEQHEDAVESSATNEVNFIIFALACVVDSCNVVVLRKNKEH